MLWHFYAKGGYFRAYLVILKSEVERTALHEHCTVYKIKATTVMLDRD